MKTLTISEDLTLEVHIIGERHWLQLRDKSLEQDDECLTGILIRPFEIRKLIDALSEAVGILAQDAANMRG